MTDPQHKPWYTRLPTVSVAVLAFLVALTTLVNNVSQWLDSEPPPAATSPDPVKPAQATPVAGPPQKLTTLITLDRIEVLDDGTAGSTAWTFEIEGGGETLFVLPLRDYSDEERHRNVVPRSSDPSIGRVVLVPGQRMLVKITGSMSGLLRRRTATGSATLSTQGRLPPIRVMVGPDGGGSFVFHFSVSTTAASTAQ